MWPVRNKTIIGLKSLPVAPLVVADVLEIRL